VEDRKRNRIASYSYLEAVAEKYSSGGMAGMLFAASHKPR